MTPRHSCFSFHNHNILSCTESAVSSISTPIKNSELDLIFIQRTTLMFVCHYSCSISDQILYYRLLIDARNQTTDTKVTSARLLRICSAVSAKHLGGVRQVEGRVVVSASRPGNAKYGAESLGNHIRPGPARLQGYSSQS